MARRGAELGMPSEPEHPCLEIGAQVKAEALRFDCVPQTDVSFSGAGDSRSERRNLPGAVESGVTYRRVRVRWHATSGLDRPP